MSSNHHHRGYLDPSPARARAAASLPKRTVDPAADRQSQFDDCRQETATLGALQRMIDGKTASTPTGAIPAPDRPAQPLAPLSGQSDSILLQRYTNGDAGSKISHSEEIVWLNPATVYAGTGQFAEANSIAGSQVFFTKGPAHQHYPQLNRVEAHARPDSELAQQTAPENYNPKEEAQQIHKMAARQFENTLYQALLEQHKEELEQIEKESGEDARFEREDELEELAAKNAPKEFPQSDVRKRMHRYLEINQHLAERPLMPSDCKAMSYYVSGFDAASGEETDEIAAGIVYEIMPPEANREAAEWSFHYATIIMTGGADHITMENAGAKASEGFPKMQYDHTWSFKMYGANEGQTFDDEYAAPMGYS